MNRLKVFFLYLLSPEFADGDATKKTRWMLVMLVVRKVIEMKVWARKVMEMMVWAARKVMEMKVWAARKVMEMKVWAARKVMEMKVRAARKVMEMKVWSAMMAKIGCFRGYGYTRRHTYDFFNFYLKIHCVLNICYWHVNS
jgi:hypothetical protein